AIEDSRGRGERGRDPVEREEAAFAPTVVSERLVPTPSVSVEEARAIALVRKKDGTPDSLGHTPSASVAIAPAHTPSRPHRVESVEGEPIRIPKHGGAGAWLILLIIAAAAAGWF